MTQPNFNLFGLLSNGKESEEWNGEYLNVMQHFISLVSLLSLATERIVRNGIVSS